MPLEAQTRLLRVLQEGEFTTIGGRTPIEADVRIIAATHRDLRDMVREGQFREDLYYRLNVVPVRLPPLRERSDDIPELVNHFFTLVEEEGLPRKRVSPEAMAQLRNYAWPGNVRELENLVRRLAALYSQDTIDQAVIEQELSDLPETERASGGGGANVLPSAESLSEAVEMHLRAYFDAHVQNLPAPGLYNRVLKEVEGPLISLTLAATKGNQVRAAELLGLNRNTLRKKIRELGLEIQRGKK